MVVVAVRKTMLMMMIRPPQSSSLFRPLFETSRRARCLSSSSSASSASSVSSSSNGGTAGGASDPQTTAAMTTTAASSSRADWPERRRALAAEQADLAALARALTLSLYRAVARSVRVIRRGNEHDESEFADRERKRADHLEASAAAARDVRLRMLSMLPPVDRAGELHSRGEYYQQYARENFVQESDCLDHAVWEEPHVARYLFHLQRGEEQRKWLLADMKFADPCEASVPKIDGADEFRVRAADYVRRARHAYMQHKLSAEEFEAYMESENQDASLADDENDDGWSTDEDDDEGDDSGAAAHAPWLDKPTKS